MTHLRVYYNKMVEIVHNEKLLIHFFHKSLNGIVLNWYIRFDNTKIRKRRDLVHAFSRQYKFNMDVAPDHSSW
jgi:hypothetical protein